MGRRLPPPNARGVTQVQNVIGGLLDRGYVDTTAQVLRAITNGTQSDLIQQRFEELQAEAERLQGEGKKLTSDNPVLRALMADLAPILERNATLIDAIAPDVQLNGVSIAGETGALSSTGLTQRQLAGVGVEWFQPNPDAINQTLEYAGTEAFQEGMGRYVEGIEDTLINQTLRGIGPRQSALEIIRMAEELPTAWANSTLRTLQVTSYRAATTANRVANQDILEYQIRISALQRGRTCMACVALHGTIYPIEYQLEDHNNGLCTSVVKVKGLPAPQVENGAAWFAKLPKSVQDEWMTKTSSSAAFRAYDGGSVKLEDFVGEYDNKVFGRQVVPKSLKDMLGREKAETFYARNQNKGETP